MENADWHCKWNSALFLTSKTLAGSSEAEEGSNVAVWLYMNATCSGKV
jgi:hypothetical protein